jgi:hypothetical protein
MSDIPEVNFETLTVAYDRRHRMWGFPVKDDPEMFLWVSTEFMREVDAPYSFISQEIYRACNQRVTESQIKFLMNTNYDKDSMILPVVSRVVFEYPEGYSND